jgi:hypothetical protein
MLYSTGWEDGWNYELEWLWRKVVVTCGIGGAKEDHNKSDWENQSLGRVLNHAPPKYQVVLITH